MFVIFYYQLIYTMYPSLPNSRWKYLMKDLVGTNCTHLHHHSMMEESHYCLTWNNGDTSLRYKGTWLRMLKNWMGSFFGSTLAVSNMSSWPPILDLKSKGNMNHNINILVQILSLHVLEIQKGKMVIKILTRRNNVCVFLGIQKYCFNSKHSIIFDHPRHYCHAFRFGINFKKT
jgi:hypothetical protein